MLGYAAVAFKPGELETKSFLKLSSYEGMRGVLLKMATNTERGHPYLNPHDIFGNGKVDFATNVLKALHPRKH